VMAFRLEPMTAEDAADVSLWRYPAPYDRYRWPPWEQLVKDGREFADPDIRAAQYLSVRGKNGGLAGYVQLFPLDRAIRIGLGLRPDLCGIGLGGGVIGLAVEEALRRRPAAQVDLEVETWNRRAILAYKKAGFTAEDEYEKPASHGMVRILCMVWQPRETGSEGTME
jgi:ribosomal-protein-alanine N-acetyltransferase